MAHGSSRERPVRFRSLTTARCCCGTAARCSPRPKPLKEVSANAFAAVWARSSGSARSTARRQGCCLCCCGIFAPRHPEVAVQLLEDKTVRLLPRLLSGALDLAFVRPPERPDKSIEFRPLLQETAVVALSQRHALAGRQSVSLADIADQPLIVPDRRSRPHSHDLTVKLFEQAGLTPRIVQTADEKQTIVNLVATRLGIAIVPRWTSRMTVSGRPLRPTEACRRRPSPADCPWPWHGCGGHAIPSGTRCLLFWKPNCGAIPEEPELATYFVALSVISSKALSNGAVLGGTSAPCLG